MIYNSCLTFLDDKTALRSLVPDGEKYLENPSRRFDGQIAPKIFNRTVEISGDCNIGMKVGTAFKPETLLDLGYAFPFCKNLREVIKINRKYQPLIQQVGRTSLSFENNSAWLAWHPNYNDPEFHRYYIEMVFTGYTLLTFPCQIAILKCLTFLPIDLIGNLNS